MTPQPASTVPVFNAAAALEKRLIKMVEIERIRYAHFREGSSIREAPDLAAALRIHDAVAYGLSASIFTRDLAVADTFVHAARAGIVHVNPSGEKK